MKKLSSPVLSISLVVAFLGGTASGALSLVSLSGDTVVLDDVSGLYWYQDLGDFSLMSRADQVDSISSLNSLPGHAGFTNWHLAERFEMETLYLNNASAISGAFLTDEEGEWIGRYNEVSGTGEYYVGGVVDDVGLVELGVHSEADNCLHTWLGAWAVASPQDTPPSAPAPGAVALVLVGLGSGILRRRCLS